MTAALRLSEAKIRCGPADQEGNLTHRHHLTQGYNQCLHQLAGSTRGAYPGGNPNLGSSWHSTRNAARNLGVDMGLVLEEVQMAPGALMGVVDRLVFRTTCKQVNRVPRGNATSKSMRPALASNWTSPSPPGSRQSEGNGGQRQMFHNWASANTLRGVREPARQAHQNCYTTDRAN